MSAAIRPGFPLTAPKVTTFKGQPVVCVPDSHFAPHALPEGAQPIRRFAIEQKAVTHGQCARFAAEVGAHYFYFDATKDAVTVADAHPLRVLLMGAALQTTGQLPESSTLDALVTEYGELSVAMFAARGFLSGGPGTVFQMPQTPPDPADAEVALTNAWWKFAAAYCFYNNCRLPTAEEWAYAKLVAGNDLHAAANAPHTKTHEGMVFTSAFHCVFPEDPLDVLGAMPFAMTPNQLFHTPVLIFAEMPSNIYAVVSAEQAVIGDHKGALDLSRTLGRDVMREAHVVRASGLPELLSSGFWPIDLSELTP